MMIARYASLMQTVQLLAGQEAHRSAQVDFQLAVHRLISVNCLIEFLARQCLASRNNRKAVYALLLVQTRQIHNLLLRQKAVHLAVRMIMRRLGAKLAVLRTASAAAIDNRTQINARTAKMLANLVCALAERLQIAGQKRLEVILTRQSSTVNNLLC